MPSIVRTSSISWMELFGPNEMFGEDSSLLISELGSAVNRDRESLAVNNIGPVYLPNIVLCHSITALN